MGAKIKAWANRALSYAGRLVLIKSVLFSLQIFWSTHFIFPKKICNEMELLLRRFLWSGTELKKHASKVSWEEVCCPTKEGGLGICRLNEWNTATMLRHIWNLCSKKSSLWTEWCNKHLLRKRDFWQATVPSDSSWTWRKILKLRPIAIKISRYKIGDGTEASLWFSNWHPLGPLVPRYGERLAYDAAIPLNSKVSTVIKHGTWSWPYPTTWELQEIVNNLGTQPDCSKKDQFMWLASASSEYSSCSTWNAVRKQHQSVSWHKLIWFPNCIPKHAFISWLAIRSRLNTKDKLVKWGTIHEDKCVFCRAETETIDHLLFGCSFSREVWLIINKLCSLKRPTLNWASEITWAVDNLNGKSWGNTIKRLAWAAQIYHLWLERNARVFKNSSSSVKCIVERIKYDVRVKAMQLNPCNVEGELAVNWGITSFCNS